MCSWLLFAAAAAGLFLGFFWALLTRQKIKKFYLCLPGLLGESKNRRRHRSCASINIVVLSDLGAAEKKKPATLLIIGKGN
jgi:dipeptide/tripeptide permease